MASYGERAPASARALLPAPALQLRRLTINGPVRIASASKGPMGGPRGSDYGPRLYGEDESCAEVGGCSGRLIRIRNQRARQAGGLTHRTVTNDGRPEHPPTGARLHPAPVPTRPDS